MAHIAKELERGGPFAPGDCNLFNHVHFGIKNGSYPMCLHDEEQQGEYGPSCAQLSALVCSCRLSWVTDFAVGPISFCLLPWLPLPFLTPPH